METTTLIYIALGVIILGAALFLLKSLVKAAFLTVVIMVVFRIGWVYTSDDIIQLFRLDKVLTPDSVVEFQVGYDDYVDKREEDPIVDPEALEETVRYEIWKKVDEYLEKFRQEPAN